MSKSSKETTKNDRAVALQAQFDLVIQDFTAAFKQNPQPVECQSIAAILIMENRVSRTLTEKRFDNCSQTRKSLKPNRLVS
ncbi:hypothetical protein C7B65_18510 [Phormidesmis priestleyi ULC007]|uniref:Uncharacterized protein n=1 Tax=Phormidesmis priestleyi ULC007 TaxID=1920490 RepID=A0A2T1DAN9_9CYAN|nr:hypothetical protein [Phormidesmis priestleyi]PSB17535.1 hypothetical protein C7B65_18510 [Phormidesmis priestleyi ULC007]PZO45522.1 MAG: hypothetical protein DCF14_24880 [Phormidesmis priestleyi]